MDLNSKKKKKKKRLFKVYIIFSSKILLFFVSPGDLKKIKIKLIYMVVVFYFFFLIWIFVTEKVFFFFFNPQIMWIWIVKMLYKYVLRINIKHVLDRYGLYIHDYHSLIITNLLPLTLPCSVSSCISLGLVSPH